jgi:hypothetical protein
VGLNVGSLDFDAVTCPDASRCPPLDDVVAHVAALGVRWIRLEVSRQQGRDPGYWSGVVDRLLGAGPNVRVLGALNGTLWDVGHDPDAPDCANASAPTGFGQRLAGEWIGLATPYVQALADRVTDWEIWNEANNDGAPNTYLCPANYGALLVAARNAWSDAAIGPSTFGLGLSAPSDYVAAVVASDPVQQFMSDNGNVPWTRLYHHPYPGDDASNPDDFFQAHVDSLTSVQPAPIWFTEFGWQVGDDGDEYPQAFALEHAYDVALNGGMVEKAFWFALTDCAGAGRLGLVAGCPFRGAPRAAYWALQTLARGCDGDDFSSDPMNCGGCGNACKDGYACQSGQCTPTQCAPETPPDFGVPGCTDITPTGAFSASSQWTGTPGGGPTQAAGNLCQGGWNSGHYAPAWWQVDFGSPRAIRGLSLLPDMLPNGNVGHRIETSLDGVNYTTAVTINQFMANGTPYAFDLGAWRPARFVRVTTTGSPSWVAWSEVGVYACP